MEREECERERVRERGRAREGERMRAGAEIDTKSKHLMIGPYFCREIVKQTSNK